MAGKQNRKGVHNMPALLDEFVQHYADKNDVTWAAALYALIVRGYDTWVDKKGLAYLDIDMGEGGLYDEYLALSEPRPSTTEFLVMKTRPKPGRPRKAQTD